MKFIRIDIRHNSPNIFVVIQEMDEHQIPYIVINRCKNVILEVPCIPAKVKLDEKALFALDEPMKPKEERRLEIVIIKEDCEKQ